MQKTGLFDFTLGGSERVLGARQCLPRGWGYPSGSSVESTTPQERLSMSQPRLSRGASKAISLDTIVASTPDYHPTTITHSLARSSRHHVQMQRFRVGSN